nr:helix-turn-helix transcriptional regulator [Stenotrophomonas geniculata]
MLLASSTAIDSRPHMPSASIQPSTRQRFGKRLQTARKAMGLTQQQLGTEIGLEIDVAATRINRYERGVHDPDSDTAQKLAKHLGMPLAYFYSDNEALAEAILTFAKLPPAQQQEGLRALRSLSDKQSPKR